MAMKSLTGKEHVRHAGCAHPVQEHGRGGCKHPLCQCLTARRILVQPWGSTNVWFIVTAGIGNAWLLWQAWRIIDAIF